MRSQPELLKKSLPGVIIFLINRYREGVRSCIKSSKSKKLNDSVTLSEIEAPFVARKAKAGQFIIFRVDEEGERVPLTIADHDAEKGTVTIIFQHVGAATMKLAAKEEGEEIADFVGPLGVASHFDGVKEPRL